MKADDPVEDPHGYIRMILGWLGDDDPAEAQAATPGQLETLVAEAGALAAVRPGTDQWSLLEVVGHVAESEIVAGARYRWILSQDRPALYPYDEEAWAARFSAAPGDLDESLQMFSALRRANLGLWSRTSPKDRARIGMHQERGPTSFEDLFRQLAGHDRLHVDQARRALDAARG